MYITLHEVNTIKAVTNVTMEIIPIEQLRGQINPEELDRMWELPSEDEKDHVFNIEDFSIQHIQGETLTELDALLTRYAHLFINKLTRKDCTDLVTHKITLTDGKPICQGPSRVLETQRQLMREIIQELLDDGIIEPSNSLYSSPALLVGKPAPSKPS